VARQGLSRNYSLYNKYSSLFSWNPKMLLAVVSQIRYKNKQEPRLTMKMIRHALHNNRLLSTSITAALALVLSVAFWFASAPKASAADCTLCHKRTLTITVECGSLDYRRHIDHGDTVGACVTPTGNQ
jgi:hypothetical protein